jgi:alpha-galactosidase
VSLGETTFLMVKDLADGTKAVGLGNRGKGAARVTASWANVGVTGAQPVRDVWRQRDVGRFEDAYAAEVGPHAVVLVKVGKPAK